VGEGADPCDPVECLFSCDGGGETDCTQDGVTCADNVDCAGSLYCNTATKRCFDKGVSCVGTACNALTDCANDETCNSETGKCN